MSVYDLPLLGRTSENIIAGLRNELAEKHSEITALRRRIKQLETGYDTLRTILHRTERQLAAHKGQGETVKDQAQQAEIAALRQELAEARNFVESWKDWHRKLVCLIPALGVVERNVTLDSVRDIVQQLAGAREEAEQLANCDLCEFCPTHRGRR